MKKKQIKIIASFLDNKKKIVEYIEIIWYTLFNSRSVGKVIAYVGGNMENRKIKLVDENGIDREGNVICKFNVNEKDYLLYSIVKTDDRISLFTSKLVNNIDGTANMVDLDEGEEKNKIVEVVKELVTYAVNNEKDKVEGAVKLADGTEVKISGVSFNKEQKFSAPKGYVAGVTPAVSKVAFDFYDAPAPETPKAEIFQGLDENPLADAPVEMAMPELTVEEPKVEETVEEKTTPELEIPAELAVTEEPKVEEKPVEEVKVEGTLAPEPVVVEKVKVEEPQKEEPTSIPAPVVTPEPETEPVKEEPVVPQFVQPAPEPVTEVKAEETVVTEEPKTVVTEPAEVEVKPLEAAPVPGLEVKPVEPVAATPAEPLLFDGAGESNLNKALGEVGDEKVVATPQEGVESLREFGVDGTQQVEAPAVQEVKTLTRSKGFANNKFFMAIAILFFVAACIFLGYEAFMYFNMR